MQPFRITPGAWIRLSILLALMALTCAAYSAYKGHADDRDVNAVVAAYPSLKNAAADSCATCHKSGRAADPWNNNKTRNENNCGYCHVVHVRSKRDVRETLNRYGADYLAEGRNLAAIKALAAKDSDGDGFTNEVEFLQGTNPGETGSNPAAGIAPHKILTSLEMGEMSPAVSQTIFLNTSHNKAGDFYNVYRGYRVHEMLRAAGIADNAETVDFISLDGFEGTFTINELKRSWPQAAPVLGLGKKEYGPCGWVNYNAPGLDPKKALPDARIMLAFEENGKKIETARLDPETGKIIGTGPLRLVDPQHRISPPDVPMYAEKSCQDKAAPEHRFNENYDHNGGRSSFAIIAIRVNPLPRGTRDYPWEKIRNQLVAEDKLVIFGALKGQ
jgi:hypothetical protein